MLAGLKCGSFSLCVLRSVQTFTVFEACVDCYRCFSFGRYQKRLVSSFLKSVLQALFKFEDISQTSQFFFFFSSIS